MDHSPSPSPASPPAGNGPGGASWIVRLAVFNPYLVVVVCLFILVIGAVALDRIAVDILPSFKTPAVQVLTLYPGMPTEIMERDITNRIERWTSQSEGISRQESRTMIGVSIVRDHFRDDIDPNTAFAQVTGYAMSDLYYLPPGTVPPMVMLYDPTAPLPTALLAASSDVLDEKESYDLAYFNVRNMLSGSPGVIAPAVFGGKLRRIYVYLDPVKLQARGLSLMDVQQAIKRSNLMIPTGNAKMGDTDYMVDMENMVRKVEELDDVVVKVDNGKPVFIKDVGEVRDTSAIQTNVVRISRGPTWEGKRQVYIPIFRRPGSNTIQVVQGVKDRTPEFLDRLPRKEGAKDSGLQLDVVADQSVFVRNAITSLEWEGVLGAVLASLSVLLFIGSVRSTVVIALTIPLSALAAIIGLYFTGQTLNAMTLGGLALVMGRLVDDPIVDIENTFRHLDMGKSARQAALDSATEIATPVLVATLTTVVVFLPVVFLSGISKYLFTPLALSVAFAMFASYLLSRTLSPAFCAYFLKPHQHGVKRFILFEWADAAYERVKGFYTFVLREALHARWLVVGGALVLLLGSLGLYPLVGQELFPATDAGQIVINVRAQPGTRIENTEKLLGRVEAVIKETVPEWDRQMIVTDIGVLYDWPAGYTANSGPMDATVLVQLTDAGKRQVSSQEYARRLRPALKETFPGVEFAFNTGGMVSAALNFGLPSPINIQVEGRDMKEQHRIARDLKQLIENNVPGAVDVRVQQTIDYPTIEIDPNRTKMAYSGISQEDTVKNLMSVLNSSTSFDPAFWLDYKTGNHYFVGVTYKETDIRSVDTLKNVPITPNGARSGDHAPARGAPVQLQNLTADAKFTRSAVEVNHVALSRVIDVYVNVEGRDVGSVSADIEQLLSRWGKKTTGTWSVSAWAPPDANKPDETLAGYTVRMRGETSSIRESFLGLAFGLALAVILIYLVMVALFRSFLDPFIILVAVPLGLIGVLLILSLTGTTLNVQSLMGVIFMVGIAVSNSILLVEFANRLRKERDLSAWDAAIESGRVRLRPILMTSLAAVVGLLPLALHEGDAAMPLARAVIGGLTASTLLTVFVVPCLYVLFKGRQPQAA
jgi:multidrug efflux pump subunit AcrB